MNIVKKRYDALVRVLMAMLLAFVCFFVIPRAALAEVTSSFDPALGYLRVESDSDDTIEIWCSDGKVWINGELVGAPDNPQEVQCSAVLKIRVQLGAGGRADLSRVTHDDFCCLAVYNIHIVRPDSPPWMESNETITGSEFGDLISSGSGDDTIYGGDGPDIIDPGLGDDTVDGQAGDDTIIVRPGSTDTLTDEEGSDTLDFSPADSGITIDVDLTGMDQEVDAAGNTVRLGGQFENFVGSSFDDVVFVDPLAAPRNLDGGAHDTGDILNFDAQGAAVTDDGTTIIAVGYAPVTYTNFETVNITNSTTPTPPEPVGGIIVPVSRLELLAPWLGLVVWASLATLTAALVRRRMV